MFPDSLLEVVEHTGKGFRVVPHRWVVDNTFQWLLRQVEEQMIVLSDSGFHAAEGDPANLKLCQRGEWQDRMLVETVLSMRPRSRRRPLSATQNNCLSP
jgi:hypothetical protein